MKKLVLLLLPFLPVTLFAQDQGVRFEQNLSWSQVKAKAKAEHKYIFMDCFTTWCGPCRYMSSTIFPTKEAGDFMNDKFINVGVQLDTTDHDNDEVKSWYQDGHDIARDFQIRAYPTYLVFSPDGEAVHRFVGSTRTTEEFIENVKVAFDPDRQYYVLLKKYQSGDRDSSFMRKMSVAALDAYDMVNAYKIVNEYLDSQDDLYKKTNLELLSQVTQKSSDKGFPIMLNDPEKVDAVMGTGFAENQTGRIIMMEEVFTKYLNEKPDWDAVSRTVHDKYPALADEVVAKSKVFYYQNHNDWNDFQYAVVDYMKKFGGKATPAELNNFAWTVFLNCPDMTCVSEALEWSKRSFENNKEPGFMDTYANILYKMGKKDEAITWEQKAMDLAPDSDKKGYQDTIDKMKRGEKTWN